MLRHAVERQQHYFPFHTPMHGDSDAASAGQQEHGSSEVQRQAEYEEQSARETEQQDLEREHEQHAVQKRQHAAQKTRQAVQKGQQPAGDSRRQSLLLRGGGHVAYAASASAMRWESGGVFNLVPLEDGREQLLDGGDSRENSTPETDAASATTRWDSDGVVDLAPLERVGGGGLLTAEVVPAAAQTLHGPWKVDTPPLPPPRSRVISMGTRWDSAGAVDLFKLEDLARGHDGTHQWR